MTGVLLTARQISTQLNDLALHEWLERPPGVRAVVVSIPNSYSVFLCRLFHVDQFTFYISLPRLKFSIFINLWNPYICYITII